MHLFLKHARVETQSGLIVHSGLHSTYGSPNNCGRHLHEAAPFLSWHSAFVPQGEGWHGLMISGLGVVAKKSINTK